MSEIAKDNDAILDAWLKTGDLETYTPDFQSTGTQPNLGTGAIKKGWFRRYSTGSAFLILVEGFFRIHLGTGATAGTGVYFSTLPTLVSAVHEVGGPGAGHILGDWIFRDATSSAQTMTGAVDFRSIVDRRIFFLTEDGWTLREFAQGIVSIADDDRFSANFAYLEPI